MRSSWREFQALHDIGQNVPLMSEILGAERTLTMATTPPHEAGTQDSPFDLSHSPLDTSSSSSAAVRTRDGPIEGGADHWGALSPVLSRQTSAASSQAAPEEPGNNAKADEVARVQNRMVVVNSLVDSWKMKGCTEKFMRYLRLKYNPSQLHAIHTAAEQQGFTLVQGPPGTGKTSTILGILNAIHIREFNQYYKLALEALLGPEGHKCRQQTYEHPWLSLVARLTAIKPRILVVAPSNTAVDNIILRVMESGFVDGNGGKYFPNILRVGAGTKSEKVKSVSLEDLINREVALVDGTTDRREMIEKLNGQVTAMITEIAFLQSMLVNLQLAYTQCNPLPAQFELRVDPKAGQPYWVDHHCKSTTLNAPTAKVLEVRGVGTVYPTIETLPDYILYSHRLTQLVTAIDAASAKRKKISNMTEMRSSYYLREAAERSVIDGAHILFSTLNGAGQPSMESSEFCVTVVDEAAQVQMAILMQA
jgi:energy-coupling factor transporter ATP-binding protein EcfA2